MFKCDICRKQQPPRTRMRKVPAASIPTPTGPQTQSEIKLCPPCLTRYETMLKDSGTGIGAFSAYAPLIP